MKIILKRHRTRSCATCSDADENGFCSEDQLSYDTAFLFKGKKKQFCPDNQQNEFEKCDNGVCLPNSSVRWKNDNGQAFKIITGWARAPGAVEYEGGCIDFETAYKKFRLDPTTVEFRNDKLRF